MESKVDSAEPVFGSEAVFRRKLKAYVKYCNAKETQRLPNVAGFCRFCKIRRTDLLLYARYIRCITIWHSPLLWMKR